MIRVEHLGFAYGSADGTARAALDDVSFAIEPGELVALAGAAGSGKTTLIQHLNGLLTAQQGRVAVGGHWLDTPKAQEAARHRVGLVFQFPEAQFFEETVFAEVAFGPRNRGWDEARIRHAVREALTQVGFDPDVVGPRSPFQLSGGEKRRVAIASTLAMGTEVLVLDEPTVGLDRRSAAAVEALLRQAHAAGRTVLCVTHDMDLIARLAHRVLVLDRGRLVFDGPPRRLFVQSALLDSAGLEPPPVFQYLNMLRSSGRAVPEKCLTLDELRRTLDGGTLSNDSNDAH